MQQTAARQQFFDLLRASIAENTFSKLTLGKYRGPDSSLQNIFVRPVSLKSGPHLSFTYRHATHDITKNFTHSDAISLLEKHMGRDFLDAHLFTARQTTRLACTSDGAARLRIQTNKQPASAFANDDAPAPAAPHDRARRQAIPLNAPWLHALGITNNHAQPREGMSAKLRQINKFAELLSHLATEAGLVPEPPVLIPIDKAAGTPAPTLPPLRVADMGCGKGYLTFATAALFGQCAHVQGIEVRAGLVSLCNRIAREQLFANLTFTEGSIAGTPFTDNSLDILIALHACDTATDDAIAKGIRAGARLIVVSPCCQKELRPQLTAPPVLADALRHGIFQERQAEFVTDALRAQLLEYSGYRTKVFEFVSTEHTAKNLMIAAIKIRAPGNEDVLRNLKEFSRFYGIRKQALASHLNIDLNS